MGRINRNVALWMNKRQYPPIAPDRSGTRGNVIKGYCVCKYQYVLYNLESCCHDINAKINAKNFVWEIWRTEKL